MLGSLAIEVLPCCPHVFYWEEKKKKKKALLYTTPFYGIGVMKIHVESKHVELLNIFVEKVVVDNISRSQIACANEGCRAMEVTKKRSKVVPSVILAFF